MVCNGRFTEKIDLEYTIEAELFTGRQVSRVTFKGAEKDTTHIIERSIRLFEQTNPQYKCKDHDVYIKVNYLSYFHDRLG